ncbi:MULTISPECIES: stage III sporulation protein AG [Clostridium]|uniref:Stage III sporulation protein AG n=2 Tax=Clostridium intestinale TaxID=36845 RepID=U2Q232_9CLOT|nr:MULTISPECIES: stage III sporulation protein AG [Clostridium]ERK30104.1 stage III sporulation protein AG [Clostridium intestinale URNW]SHI17407.1 stage III sporulation protein AG [Clostridium intestinale DSM 6191]
MDKNDLKNNILKSLKDPKLMNIIAILLIAVFAFVVLSFFNKDGQKTVAKNTTQETETVAKTNEISNYEEAQKEELRKILRSIKGVGEVQVMMYFESSESKVPAIDTNEQASVTEETDGNSGKRVTNQNNNASKVVMASGDDPLILKTLKPKVTGIVVVAEGAEASKIKYDITKACSGLYDVSSDKINVYPMK